MSPTILRRALLVVAALLGLWTWRGSGTSPVGSDPGDIANPVARLRAAERERAAGNLSAAILHARAAALLAPELPDARWDLAALLTASGQLNEAFVHYDVALKLDPQPSAEHLSNLGMSLALSGRNADAVLRFRKAIELSPDVAWIHENLGYVLAATGDLEGARSELQTAVRLDPSATRARDTLATLPAAAAPRGN